MGGGPEPPAQKRNPSRKGRTCPAVSARCLPAPAPWGPPSCRSRWLDVGTAPARRTRGAAPPGHLHPHGPDLQDQLWGLGPPGARGHLLRYSRGHARVRNAEPETEAPLGDTHVHSQVAGDTVTLSHSHSHTHTFAQTHSRGHKGTPPKTRPHRYHRHTPERPHAPPRAQNSRHTRGHGDSCTPPARRRHRKTLTHTWPLAPGAPAPSPGNNNSPAGGRGGRPSIPPLVELGAPRGGEEVGAGGGRGD